jgi:hypothetical protein
MLSFVVMHEQGGGKELVRETRTMAEHNLKQTFANYCAAKEAVDEATRKYNEIRIHDSCGRLTPLQAHEQKSVLKNIGSRKCTTSDRFQPQIPDTVYCISNNKKT